eukprot:TRINITY_DN1316_c0_g2_i2.p1 TRINITY_DN1316_c0_g2~~TRINITY_DN1316_c0_g2_i2.p1  ORF type:complete len:846 (-),score=257.11 TRINITY_DN1316_c0_g2_i2:182-2719(-)
MHRRRGLWLATVLHVTSTTATAGDNSAFLQRGDVQQITDLAEPKGDFLVGGSNFVSVPDVKSVLAAGAKQRGGYKKIAKWSEGKGSDCETVGCFWPRGFFAGGPEGLEVCQAQCYLTEGCDVIDFCPRDARGQCDMDRPTPMNPLGNGISRCCMRTCRKGHATLDKHWHGWDIYELPTVGKALVPPRGTEGFEQRPTSGPQQAKETKQPTTVQPAQQQPKETTVQPAQQQPKETEQPTTVQPAQQQPKELFDCDAALGRWRTAWSSMKQEWCCQNHQKGCKEEPEQPTTVQPAQQQPKETEQPTTVQPAQQQPKELFDCDAALGRWRTAWSSMKQEWCCQNHQKGCKEEPEQPTTVQPAQQQPKEKETAPPAPAPTTTTAAPTPTPTPAPTAEVFNCDAGLGKWIKSWSSKKQEYCCKNYQKGCKEETFDCWTEVEDIKKDWPMAQQKYCCLEHGVGCKATPFPWAIVLFVLVCCCCCCGGGWLYSNRSKANEHREYKPVLAETELEITNKQQELEKEKEEARKLLEAQKEAEEIEANKKAEAEAEAKRHEEYEAARKEAEIGAAATIADHPAWKPKVAALAPGEEIHIALSFTKNTSVLEDEEHFTQELKAVTDRFHVLDYKHDHMLCVHLTTPVPTGHNVALMQKRGDKIKQCMIAQGLEEELVQINPVKYHEAGQPRSVFQSMLKEDAAKIVKDTEERVDRKKLLRIKFDNREAVQSLFSFKKSKNTFEDNAVALKEAECIAELLVHTREVLVVMLATPAKETQQGIKGLLDSRSKTVTQQLLRVGVKKERVRFEYTFGDKAALTKITIEVPGEAKPEAPPAEAVSDAPPADAPADADNDLQ